MSVRNTCDVEPDLILPRQVRWQMSGTITRLNADLEGRYHVERELGEGRMATDYVVDDIRHERKFALKVLEPELASRWRCRAAPRQTNTTANLQHSRILAIFDFGGSGCSLRPRPHLHVQD